jgi:hypothetical protein
MRRAGLVLLALVAVGCGSTRLPAKLSSAERQRVEAARLPLTVGVEPSRSTGDLVRFLRGTGLFTQVEPLEGLAAPPDLVVRYEDRCSFHRGGFVPLLPILTLGIVPQWARFELGYAFSFHSSGGAGEPVLIGCGEAEGTMVVGWLGIPLNVLPNWTLQNPEESERFYNRLALAIAKRREDLVRLARKDI